MFRIGVLELYITALEKLKEQGIIADQQKDKLENYKAELKQLKNKEIGE